MDIELPLYSDIKPLPYTYFILSFVSTFVLSFVLSFVYVMVSDNTLLYSDDADSTT